jgi:hypothetical protein
VTGLSLKVTDRVPLGRCSVVGSRGDDSLGAASEEVVWGSISVYQAGEALK